MERSSSRRRAPRARKAVKAIRASISSRSRTAKSSSRAFDTIQSTVLPAKAGVRDDRLWNTAPRSLRGERGAWPGPTPEGHVDQFLQHLLNAVMLGGTYALLGIGLTLIFGIMRVVNFAHGELYAFGAYTVYLVAAAVGLNFFLGLVAAVIAGALLGALIEVVLLRPMRGADIDTVMLVMIGAWIVMQNTELFVWGGVAKAIVTPFPDAPLVMGPVSISWLRVFVLAAALLLIVAS